MFAQIFVAPLIPILLWSASVSPSFSSVNNCKECSLTPLQRRDDEPNEAFKAVCHGNVESLEAFCINHLPKGTRVLEITNTSIHAIPANAFAELPALRKLDIRHNSISQIEHNAFSKLQNIRRLDISHNKLSEVESEQFAGLRHISRLKLGHNPLRKVSLEEVSGLRALDLTNTRLICDCHLRWIVKAAKLINKPLKLIGSPTCAQPLKFAGKKIKKLDPREMDCDFTGKTVLDMEPGMDQVVFAGDSLLLRCLVKATKVTWKYGDQLINSTESELDIKIHTIEKDETIESYIEIPEVSWGHSGEWSCSVEGMDEKKASDGTEKTISIYVIHRHTKYCSANVTTNNKGIYSWPRTVANVLVDLPCVSHKSAWPHKTLNVATHTCQNGTWTDLDTSQCAFVSETTRILEHFATTDLITAKANLYESSRALMNFTTGSILRDPMDIVLLSRTVSQYANLLRPGVENHPTAKILLQIISSMMVVDKEILDRAQQLNDSCSSLVRDLWTVGSFLPPFSVFSSLHMNFNQISLTPQAGGEVSCVWFRKIHSLDHSFLCGLNNSSLLYTIAEDITDARIRIPSSNFNSADTNSTETESITLQFLVFDSAKLYPSYGSWHASSPVIGIRVLGQDEELLNATVYLTFRTNLFSNDINALQWVDQNWTHEGCNIMTVLNSMTVFGCNKLTEYGLFQNIALTDFSMKPFEPSPLGVYLGSIVCSLFLMASVATWCIHHQRICTTNKNKHSFVNTWIALLFLISFFTVGVYQTESPGLCRIIGLLLHYLSTCVLLWIIVSVTNLYKKISKTIRPQLPTDSQELPLPPKPMFRFYLVGWGIAMILCGISAAVNLDHYSTYSYCFLAWNPSIAGFYVPSAVLLLILVAFFLLTQCLLRSSRGYSETTGNTETTELELLDTVSPSSENPPSVHADELSIISEKSALSIIDSQHSPTTQLRAHAVTLLLFILTWASAAITAASVFESVIPHHTTIFSALYALCASSLGAFIFMFFCVFRTDVMDAWKDFTRIPSYKENGVSNNVVINSFSNPQNNQLTSIAPSVHSESSHTVTNKSSSLAHSIPMAKKTSLEHKPKLNLSALSENVQYAPELFYNPKQSGVAKRFFQKQRLKQMVKQNNLETHLRKSNAVHSDCNSSTVYKLRSLYNNSESDASSFDPNCLGPSNKINNVNIHVDSYCKNKHSKSPTPELLCVLGPPKEPCHIVNSMENNQHLWPDSFHLKCAPRYLQDVSSGSDKVTCAQNKFDKKKSHTVQSDYENEKHYQRHKKRKRPKSKVRRKSLSQNILDEEKPFVAQLLDDDRAAALSPLSFSSLPCPSSCLGTPSSFSPSSHRSPFPHADIPCEHIDWWHLMNKKCCDDCDEKDCSKCKLKWTGSYCPSDDTNSISTSLVPGVDTTPPESIAVSDSPFDSPLHKFHQNTPDSISLDSGSVLSPLRSKFPSCDSAQLANTPTELQTTDRTITPVLDQFSTEPFIDILDMNYVEASIATEGSQSLKKSSSFTSPRKYKKRKRQSLSLEEIK